MDTLLVLPPADVVAVDNVKTPVALAALLINVPVAIPVPEMVIFARLASAVTL